MMPRLDEASFGDDRQRPSALMRRSTRTRPVRRLKPFNEPDHQIEQDGVASDRLASSALIGLDRRQPGQRGKECVQQQSTAVSPLLSAVQRGSPAFSAPQQH